jgi:L-lactate dehydrogenase (cytochrome)
MRLCGITDLNAVRGDLSYLNTRELELLLPPRPPPQQQTRSWFSRLAFGGGGSSGLSKL